MKHWADLVHPYILAKRGTYPASIGWFVAAWDDGTGKWYRPADAKERQAFHAKVLSTPDPTWLGLFYTDRRRALRRARYLWSQKWLTNHALFCDQKGASFCDLLLEFLFALALLAGIIYFLLPGLAGLIGVPPLP